MAEREGIELLRYAVNLLGDCNESFNARFNTTELIRIADACQRCEWDMYPDQWSERQIRECVRRGIVPQFREDERGAIVPVYAKRARKPKAA